MKTSLTKAELAEYQKKLLQLGQRLKKDMGGLQCETLHAPGADAGANLSNVPIHMADLGTDTFEEEINISLMENEEKILEEVALALDRIDKGTFGCCDHCGRAIPKERLEALPYARSCVECARLPDSQTS